MNADLSQINMFNLKPNQEIIPLVSLSTATNTNIHDDSFQLSQHHNVSSLSTSTNTNIPDDIFQLSKNDIMVNLSTATDHQIAELYSNISNNITDEIVKISND